MTIATGTYTGNFDWQKITLGFEPEFVAVFGATTQNPVMRFANAFCNRSHPFYASIIGYNAIRLLPDGFVVDDSAAVNANAVTYHYLALARSADFALATASWLGNNATGRPIQLDDATVQPTFGLVKRDNNRSAVARVTGQTTGRLTGSSPQTISNGITGYAAGEITIGSAVEVNEFDDAQDLGEGIEFVGWGAGDNVAHGTYTGNGAASRDITMGGFASKAIFIYKMTGANLRGGRVKTDTMAGNAVANLGGTAMTTGITLNATGVTIADTTGYNENSATYAWAAIKDHAGTPTLPRPAVIYSGKKAVYLPAQGINSYIDCGTDDSLMIDGALTIEVLAAAIPGGSSPNIPMIVRGETLENTDFGYSWGLGALYMQGGGQDWWPGPSMCAVTGTQYDTTDATLEIEHTWRTGWIPELGLPLVWHLTHNGSGRWYLYKNGVVAKQRNLDLTTLVPPIPNIDSQTGHHTTIGALRNAGGYTKNGRLLFGSARVYNRALSQAEVTSRFARLGLGSADPDITTGLVEEWDAANASGTSLPATVASANDGTITNGTIVTL